MKANFRIATWLALLLLSVPATVRAQFQFVTNAGAITITEYTGPGGSVVIPSTTNGLPVTGIGIGAFYNLPLVSEVTIPNSVTNVGDDAFEVCNSLAGVTFGNGVTSIGEYAFSDCPNLTSVAIPNSVTSIGEGVFYDCVSLASVTIPNSVTNIGEGMVDWCLNLTNITVNSQNPNYSSLNGVLFDESQTMLIEYPDGLAGSYVIPNSVTDIETFAFEDCLALTSVTIPNSVTNIGEDAFYDCTNLTDVTIPNGVISIEEDAFEDCSALTSIVIPNSVTNIGFDAFAACPSLSTITVDAANPAYSSVAGVLFSQNQTTLIEYPCGAAGNYVIPDSVTSIGDHAFDGDGLFLTGVTIPNSVTNIGNSAFAWAGLTSVTIPNSVTSIGACAFAYSRLSNITLGSGVTSIGDYAFEYCGSLAQVFCLGNAPDTGTNLFYGDVLSNNANISTVSVYFVQGTTGWSATFAGCPTGLWLPSIQASYTTTNSTITIAKYFGSGGSVSIPGTINGLPVTGIGTLAFIRSDVTNVTMSAGLTTIGEYAFDGSALTSVIIPGTIASIGEEAFFECPRLAGITILNGVTSIGAGAFMSCDSLTNVFIPDSVTNIGDAAFEACLSLTNFTVSAQNANYSSLNGVLFNNNLSTLIEYPPGILADAYTVPASVTSIAGDAFWECPNLASILIPSGVTSVGSDAIVGCDALTGVFFMGNAPANSTAMFGPDGPDELIYNLPGTTGWTTLFYSRALAFWKLPYPLILSSGTNFGVQSNRFSFTISWATNLSVVVEACTNLANPIWSPIQTCALNNGSFYFTDPHWTNYPGRFYRISSP